MHLFPYIMLANSFVCKSNYSTNFTHLTSYSSTVIYVNIQLVKCLTKFSLCTLLMALCSKCQQHKQLILVGNNNYIAWSIALSPSIIMDLGFLNFIANKNVYNNQVYVSTILFLRKPNLKIVDL